jgi:acyl phosphate:glycerol-3-phosphate acyltransferase
MIGNAFLTGVIAFVIGYLFGSIPTAYLLTKWKTGQDIRKVGGGNVGGLNTFKAVSKPLAIAVIAIDVAKGAAVILITHYGLKLDQPFVLLASIAAIIGHNWMVWLKFTGGKGLGVTIGTMLVLLPVYHYFWQLVIFIGIIVLMLAITRNIALSSTIALLSLPFIMWLYPPHSGQGQMVIWSLALGLIILAKFTPTMLRALHKDSDVKHYIKGS